MDFTRASELTPDVEAAIDDAFEYHPWNEDQRQKGSLIKSALSSAVKDIITLVPPSPDRSAAIRKLREARMDCNSAITHQGRY
jgi:hypothetical protein